MENKFAKIRIDMLIKTDINIIHNGPDIVVLDKKINEMIFVGITSQRKKYKQRSRYV
ncbi:MAG: hypothetical protein O7C59_05900 [Rickettsia endosymbiont of Ixodes persulcatus]|nr:hypothetical protein [Rickettsia endosymbiont of Ixodes persulcatus]